MVTDPSVHHVIEDQLIKVLRALQYTSILHSPFAYQLPHIRGMHSVCPVVASVVSDLVHLYVSKQ